MSKTGEEEDAASRRERVLAFMQAKAEDELSDDAYEWESDDSTHPSPQPRPLPPKLVLLFRARSLQRRKPRPRYCQFATKTIPIIIQASRKFCECPRARHPRAPARRLFLNRTLLSPSPAAQSPP